MVISQLYSGLWCRTDLTSTDSYLHVGKCVGNEIPRHNTDSKKTGQQKRMSPTCQYNSLDMLRQTKLSVVWVVEPTDTNANTASQAGTKQFDRGTKIVPRHLTHRLTWETYCCCQNWQNGGSLTHVRVRLFQCWTSTGKKKESRRSTREFLATTVRPDLGISLQLFFLDKLLWLEPLSKLVSCCQ